MNQKLTQDLFLFNLTLEQYSCSLLCTSTMRVHDSQAQRKMDVTRERISRILESREMRLSFPNGFSLVNAAVFCAILVSISGLEPSSDTTEPRNLKVVIVSKFCPVALIPLLMPLVLFVINSFFSALIFVP